MNLETFFEKFELFASAASAVPKVRELVLDLAVRGNLVAQDASDQPSRELLKSAKVERAKLVAARKIKAREVPPVKTTEQPFELPSSWAWARLAEVCHELEQKIPDKRFTYIDVGAIDSSKGRISDRVETLEPEEAPSRARKLVTPGTVIYSMVRPYLLNIAIVEHAYDPEPIASTAFGILQPFAGIYNRYLFYWLRSAPFTAYVQDSMKGMAYPAINDEKLYGGLIALPPLAEQKRIVRKVDELMALCDRLEAQQQERETQHTALTRASLVRFADAPTPANLSLIFHKSYDVAPADLRKSILALAVQGKLVPQDPSDEPADEMLARIAEAKLRLQKTSQSGKEKPVDPLHPDDLPFEVPDFWRWRKLADITELITKGSSPKWQGIAYVSESEGVLFITSENVGNYRLRKLADLKYVETRFNEIEPRSILRRGDILMNLVGASIGRTAIYDLHDGANINQAVALIRLVHDTEGVCPGFLLHYLNSPSAIDYMLSSRVVNAQPNISLTDAREFAVPIPPLPEQRRIVAKMDQLMALVDQLEAQLTASRASAVNLLEAIIAELPNALVARA